MTAEQMLEVDRTASNASSIRDEAESIVSTLLNTLLKQKKFKIGMYA
jgi:hypothetical protein